MKRDARIPGLLLLLLVAAGCSRSGGEAAPAADGPPTRIVALTAGAVDILAEFGELDRVVGVEEDCTIPGVEGKARIRNDDHAGPARAISVESVLALKPDAIIAKPELRQALGGRGVRIVYTPERVGMKTMHPLVMDVANLVGAPEKGKRLLARMYETRDRIHMEVDGFPAVRVYFEESGMGRTYGPDTIVSDMIDLAGGKNIADNQTLAKPQMSSEAILAADPQVIILSPWTDSPDEVAKRPGWDRITAVKEGRVYQIPFDDRRVMYYSPKCVEGCEKTFVPWIHPDARKPAEFEAR